MGQAPAFAFISALDKESGWAQSLAPMWVSILPPLRAVESVGG